MPAPARIAMLIDRVNQALKRVSVLPLYAVALVPGLLLFWQAFSGNLGADPLKGLERGLGEHALQFMLAALAVTPLRIWTGLSLIRFRRMLGLTVLYYAIAHFSVYLLLDQQLYWWQILSDLYKRPYIIFGMLAFLAILPLGLTSTDAAVRWLGAMKWKRLHKLAYPAIVLMVLHYLWLVKTWTAEPLTYAAIAMLLLGLRLLPDNRPPRARRKIQPAASNAPAV